ncbi:TonB-dependent receptor [Aliivibrio finisterrensis]|uniref:TonB-dependent receptor n=1 Tax=Aliivibrio finisterrensis TaxID=511998 RepID=A0A4Q5KIE6_9GAMM|nr:MULTISPECIES: TonB-dependent receptor [Aliivibrio]MDD9175865.1 TonB-dependent receptor [Aliivibrio sp. S3TY1]MDD9192881.1 TonB-dependent receptor [Aliivibrio sp. S2TY2]RYU45990.1 TonB-dependent receptor [Aliivibrio finisterrensis]
MRFSTLSLYSSLFLTSSFVFANDEDLSALMLMSLEDLSMLEVSVTSASKREQHISEIPAAIYVISNERIVRSGAKTIADALSLAPGIEVSQFNESNDFVSSRGFHDGLFNKMLVMIDGRSVFSPMYGGAFWENIDYILADIERIEIIRGPAGTIWGGNAVNGVINIITKSTKETLGTYGQIAYGQHGYKEASVRHGLQFNDNTTARAFYKAKDTFSVIDKFQSQYESDKVNTISIQTAGVKFDIEEGNSSWMLAFGGEKSAQYYDWYTVDMSDLNRQYDDSYKSVDSSSLYGQVNHTIELANSQWQTNLWYWQDKDNSPDAHGEFNTIDLDSVYTLQYGSDVTILIGGGLRHINIKLQDSSNYDVSHVDIYNRYSSDPISSDTTSNVYAQIDYNFTEQFMIQVGAKAEYFTLNDYFEVSPQIRGLYSISASQKIWFGVGRAVVTPSYFEQKSTYTNYYSYVYENNFYDGVSAYLPSTSLDNESVITIDAGYRFEGTNVNMDLTAYSSSYNNVRGHDYIGYLNDGIGNYYDLYEFNDDYEAQTYGAEVAIEWDINSSLKNYTSYSYLSFSQDRVQGDSNASGSDDYFEINHQNMLSNQLLWQVTNSIQWDFVVNYKDIDYTSDSNQFVYDVDNLISLDSRIGWKKHENAPLVEVMVKNIGMSSKCELNTNIYYDQCNAYETEQSIYGRVSYEF